MRKRGFLLLFIVLFLSCQEKLSQSGYWSVSRVGTLPEATSNQAVSEGFVNKKAYIYSFGGIDSTKLYSGIHQRSYRFDVEMRQCERIEDLPDSLGKIASAASRIDNVIYIIGGYHVFDDGTERSSGKVHRFDILRNRFLEDGANIPVPIDDHVQLVWKNRYIIVITGWSDHENVPDVQVYDSSVNQWAKASSVPDENSFKSFGASGSIIGDTIYYLGGASMGQNYPIQSVLRKGVINKGDPTEISWSQETLESQYAGYRMASFEKDGRIYWIGGSNNTYNYNGVAYDGTGGIDPNNRILSYHRNGFDKDFNKNITMDLRGIANIDDSVKYLVGGMQRGQEVSKDIIKLEWIELK